MKRNTKRKAFTTVELVIVIAVIAILATVLVPTFSNLVGKANDSKALQEAKNAHTSYLIENGGTAPEYMLYNADGRWVALKKGAPMGAYTSREEAVAALRLSEDKFTDSGDEKLWVYDEDVVTDTDWSGASAVFVGDSITYGASTDKTYHAYLKTTMSLGHITNMGINSSCISTTSNYGTEKSPLINRYHNIPDAELIVIFMGTNDFGHASTLGTINDTTDVSFYGAMNIVIPKIKEAHPNSQIVIMTPLHRYHQTAAYNGNTSMTSPYDNQPNSKGHTLVDYVNALKEIAAKYSVPVIDLFTLFTLDPTDAQVRSEYMTDGLHPNARGHEIMAEIIAEELKNIPRKEHDDSEPAVESDFVNGNQFSANHAKDTHSATAIVNLWLTKGTVVKMKDVTNYQWALAPTTGEDIKTLKSGIYYHATGWTSDVSCTINDTGWYGFIVKIKDGTTGVDFLDVTGKNVFDYFEVITPDAPQ